MASVGARPVLIAGGGIGGLAAALGLAQKGIRSILLEKAARLGEIGAGLQLGPNAFHAFDYLGIGEAARGTAVYIDQLRLMDALTAEEITHVDLRDAFRARKTSFATARTGGSGFCATAIRFRAGSMAASRCLAMPRIR